MSVNKLAVVNTFIGFFSLNLIKDFDILHSKTVIIFYSNRRPGHLACLDPEDVELKSWAAPPCSWRCYTSLFCWISRLICFSTGPNSHGNNKSSSPSLGNERPTRAASSSWPGPSSFCSITGQSFLPAIRPYLSALPGIPLSAGGTILEWVTHPQVKAVFFSYFFDQ